MPDCDNPYDRLRDAAKLLVEARHAESRKQYTKAEALRVSTGELGPGCRQPVYRSASRTSADPAARARRSRAGLEQFSGAPPSRWYQPRLEHPLVALERSGGARLGQMAQA
jgi:hypothetical protein